MLRDKIEGVITARLARDGGTSLTGIADAIMELVARDTEAFAFAIATKVSQREARIAKLTEALDAADAILVAWDNSEAAEFTRAIDKYREALTQTKGEAHEGIQHDQDATLHSAGLSPSAG